MTYRNFIAVIIAAIKGDALNDLEEKFVKFLFSSIAAITTIEAAETALLARIYSPLLIVACGFVLMYAAFRIQYHPFGLMFVLEYAGKLGIQRRMPRISRALYVVAAISFMVALVLANSKLIGLAYP